MWELLLRLGLVQAQERVREQELVLVDPPGQLVLAQVVGLELQGLE